MAPPKVAQREMPGAKSGACEAKGGLQTAGGVTTTTESDVGNLRSKKTIDPSTGDDNALVPPRPKPQYNPVVENEDKMSDCTCFSVSSPASLTSSSDTRPIDATTTACVCRDNDNMCLSRQ